MVHRDNCEVALLILVPFVASKRDQGISHPTSRMAVVVTRAIRKAKWHNAGGPLNAFVCYSVSR